MSALQSDLFGLMGEGDIQRCGPEICLISAECEPTPTLHSTIASDNHVDATQEFSRLTWKQY